MDHEVLDHEVFDNSSRKEDTDDESAGGNNVYANAYTTFSFGQVEDEKADFQHVYAFQINRRPLGSLLCHTHQWRIGVRVGDDDCQDTCHCHVNEFLESITQAPRRRVVICASTEYPCWKSSVSKMEVQIKPWRDGDGWQAACPDDDETIHVMEDLDQALSIAREVIAMTPIDHPQRLNRIRLFVTQLRMRFSRTRVIKDLDEPTAITRQTVSELHPSNPERPHELWTLAQLLGDRCIIAADLKGMEEALRLGREAIAATDPDTPLQLLMMGSLGQNLNISYDQTKDLKELEEAIVLVRHVIAVIPRDVADIANYYCILGTYLDKRFSRTQAKEDRDESTKYFQMALRCEEAKLATHSKRGVESHVHAGRQLLSRPDIIDLGSQTYDDAVLAVSFIPQSTSHTASAADSMDLLLDATGVASDAAAIALHFGKGAEEAVLLLEAGRGVLAGNIHNLRADISELRKEDARAADGLESVTRRLDAAAIRDEPRGSTYTFALSSTDQRHWDERQLGGLLDVIRKKDGFDRFFLPPVEEKITNAAALGPIVMLNVSVHRCDALIIEDSGIRAVPLPNLTYNSIQDRVRMNEIQSMKTLEWLWDVVVEPVLEVLGFTTAPSGNSWPHVWWIPTGLLTRFPLHAAGYHLEGDDRTALDRVISSYSSSVKTIISIRHRRRQDQLVKTDGSIVLISMKETPGLTPLAYTDDEINAVRAQCTSAPFQDLSVISPPPQLEEITSAIKTCSIFHFAGHGQAETTPLESQLCLHDRDYPLTVAGLIETNLSISQPFLAYLSACGTGKNPEDESADESLHLASVFHLAGFRHVIGTLWEVDDHLCVDMAKIVYELLGKNGLNDESVGTALHQATRTLRNEWLVLERLLDEVESAFYPESRRRLTCFRHHLAWGLSLMLLEGTMGWLLSQSLLVMGIQNYGGIRLLSVLTPRHSPSTTASPSKHEPPSSDVVGLRTEAEILGMPVNGHDI
ncbi:hypothetical protein CP533_6097 [Ophiocordyceps camponoti-saundersi (nom. inval.)]|nr:hypothetical protein CP533_6097 [Ophiocordyceps camponoti-saundersi (nom. inval.)]